jgi:hypothetical protein
MSKPCALFALYDDSVKAVRFHKPANLAVYEDNQPAAYWDNGPFFKADP